jgi:hypothetical protein
MNIGMRLLSQMFPDYITTNDKQIDEIESPLTNEQKERKLKCAKLWLDQ